MNYDAYILYGKIIKIQSGVITARYLFEGSVYECDIDMGDPLFYEPIGMDIQVIHDPSDARRAAFYV